MFVLGLLMAFTPFGTRLVDGLPLAALVRYRRSGFRWNC